MCLLKVDHLVKHKNAIKIFLSIHKDLKVLYNSERLQTKNTHGTGCASLSSAVTTFVSCGKPVKEVL